jgi:hypothetical protein
MLMNSLTRMLVALGSVATIGFGVWHFFVPAIWRWYSYIDPRATELALAVRAINVFFSLSLVLFGAMNLLLLWGAEAHRYPVLVVLGATSLLWVVRVGLQVLAPQGTMRPAIRFGLLAAFLIIALSFVISFSVVAAGGRRGSSAAHRLDAPIEAIDVPRRPLDGSRISF